MSVFGKLVMLMLGLMIAALGALAIYTLLGWPHETVSDLAVLIALIPLAATFTLSGIYIAWKGLAAGKVYVSPTGTGETGPER